MIIRQDKSYETNSLYLNINWYEDEDNYIIDETTEEGQQLKQRYIENYPFVDFEHDGELVTNVIVLERLPYPPEMEGKLIELTKNEQGEWEYIYVDIPLTKEQELEVKIQQLEQENINIMLAAAETYETMYQENTNLMIAIAEVYETMLGGAE